MELTQQLSELTGVISTFKEKAQEEIKALGATTKGTADSLTALQKQVDAIDLKLAEKSRQAEPDKPVVESLKENAEVERLMRTKSGRATFELSAKQSDQIFGRKAVLASAAGFQTTGVLPIDRMPGITPEARQVLKIRDLLRATPTSMGVVDYVKVNAALVNASPQQEGNTKYANAVTFTSASERVKTLATYIKASRQILDDFAELADFLNTGLTYYTDASEEAELLSGSNVGEHLNGLITQASAFTTSLLPAAGTYNKMDIIARAIQQVEASKEISPTFGVIHPTDWWGMRLTKDAFGRYLLGDPQVVVTPSLFGRPMVVTTSIASGTFLVGNGDPAAAMIRDRMTTTVDISTENEDDFIKNLVTIRVEKRLALVVRRPASFITGTLINSPA